MIFIASRRIDTAWEMGAYISMRWSELKHELTSLSSEEKSQLDLIAALVKVRKLKNMTQAQLAIKANLTQTQIARVENFTYKPSLETLMKIVNGLDLDLALVDRSTRQIG